MKKYLEGGGSIFVMLGEGGEKRFGTNINFLLEEYGIMVNNDAVNNNDLSYDDNEIFEGGEDQLLQIFPSEGMSHPERSP